MMSQLAQGSVPPTTAPHLRTRTQLVLADQAAIFDDLPFVPRGCELLITQLERRDERDEVALESLWVSALSSHARCSRPRANAGWVSR